MHLNVSKSSYRQQWQQWVKAVVAEQARALVEVSAEEESITREGNNTAIRTMSTALGPADLLPSITVTIDRLASSLKMVVAEVLVPALVLCVEQQGIKSGSGLRHKHPSFFPSGVC